MRSGSCATGSRGPRRRERVRLLAVAALALTAAVALSADAGSTTTTFSGRIVYASVSPLPGQPGGAEIYSLSLSTRRLRDLSRNSEDDSPLALSPNGKLIAFVRAGRYGDNAALWVMRTDGRDQRRLVALQQREYGRVPELTWSPDSRTIAYTAFVSGGIPVLFTVAADGSAPRQLTDVYTDGPAWSPSGNEIAFAGGSDTSSLHIGVVTADGSGTRWLTNDADVETEPAWSHDGRRIAFVRTIGPCDGSACSSSNLYTVGVDGSGERQLTTYLPSAYSVIALAAPAWSPDGRRLAFFAYGDAGHLNVINADGSGLRTFARHAFAPASWSPSGDALAFGQQRGTGLRFTRVTVQPLVGRARPYALESASSPVLDGPYWENARTLVFSSTVPTTDLELFTTAPDGRGVRRLTADRVDEFQPAWSPNGRWIAYGRGRLVKETDRIVQSSLYLMDSTGGLVRRLTRGKLDDGPSWAPDGKRLVFLRGNGLFVLDLARGRVRPLHVTADSAPSWSPDGTAIAFGVGTRLEIVRRDGTHRRVLFDGGNDGVPAAIGRPAWSSDSRLLAADVFYDHGSWTHDRKVIVSRSGGEPAPVGCIPGQPPYQPEGYGLTDMAWSPDDRSVVLDGLVVCRVDGSGGHWLHPGAEPDWQRRPR